MNGPHHTPGTISRSRVHDILFVLLGVLALVMKGRIDSGFVQSYGGNIAGAFSAFFLFKPPSIHSRFQDSTAAALALLATELFEATDGFGFMSNTYDPADYLANAMGVALAAAVNAGVQLLVRRSDVRTRLVHDE